MHVQRPTLVLFLTLILFLIGLLIAGVLLVRNLGTHQKTARLEPVEEASQKSPPSPLTSRRHAGSPPRPDAQDKTNEGPIYREPPHQSVRDALKGMLIVEQISLLGHGLDGAAYANRRVLFRKNSVKDVIKHSLYNPSQLKLSSEQETALRLLLDGWNKKLRPTERKINRLERDYARKQFRQSGNLVVPRKDSETVVIKERPHHFLEMMVTLDGPDVQGTFRFQPGTLPERDALLYEQSLHMVDAEFELISFFSVLSGQSARNAGKTQRR